MLNQPKTLENFVVNSTNRVAAAACRLAANPSTSAYNPLLIYGPSGSGKTHLLQAVCAMAKEKNYRAEYFSAYDVESLLMNRFSDKKTTLEHLSRYDVLCFDDLGFLRNRKATAQIFADLVNRVAARGVQVIMASGKSVDHLVQSVWEQNENALHIDLQPADRDLREQYAMLCAKGQPLPLNQKALAFLIAQPLSVPQMRSMIALYGAQMQMTQTPADLARVKRDLKILLDLPDASRKNDATNQ